MRIGVLGAGALGRSVGGLLTQSGLDVTLIDRPGAYLDALREQGLRLREQDRDTVIRVQATGDIRTAGPIDLMIVLVKSYHTEEAVRSAAPLVGRKPDPRG